MNIGIVGAPVDLGADRRGVDMGPSAIRYAGLAARLRDEGHALKDFGNIPTPVAETQDDTLAHLKYLMPILGMAEQLAGCVDVIVRDNLFPVVLGGDHSISLGSVAGLTRHRNLGIIWLDAHGDFNVPATSPSGNIHGMVLSALCGYGDERLVSLDGRGRKVDPRNVALIGVRELDAGERTLLRSSGVQVLTMHDVDRLGMPRTVELALDHFDQNLDGIHVSLDLDVVDPLQAPGVGTPVLGGLSYRETHLAMELLEASHRVASLDVVEVNPILDHQNATARLAVEFILSGLGKRTI